MPVRTPLAAALLLLLAAHTTAAAQAPAVSAAPAPGLFPVSGSPSRVLLEAPALAEAGRGGSRTLLGAGIGLAAGAGATYLVLHRGGSTSPCDRDANQDAMSEGECLGLVALGGVVGAGVGALIGSRFRSGGEDASSAERAQVAVAPLPSRRVAVTFGMAF